MIDEPEPIADVNPYAVTPAIASDEILSGASVPQRPTYKLYSPWSVVLATVFGSTLAGGILLAINFRRLGRNRSALTALVAGLFVTVALLVVGYLLPDDRLSRMLSLPTTVAMWFIADSLFKKTLANHYYASGKLASAWGASGIGLACMVMIFAACFGVESIFAADETKIIVNKNDEIYAEGEATDAEARELGRILTEEGIMGGDGVSVVLSKAAGQCTVSFVVGGRAWNDAETVDYYQSLGETLADDFLGRPLEIHLCDQYLDVKKTLAIPSTP